MQPNNGPDPNYEFILKDNPTPKRSLLPNMGKPAKLILVVVASFVLLGLIYALFFYDTSGSAGDRLLGIAGRAQEISRISSVQQANLKDPSVVSLAATAAATAASDKAQISSYLKKQGIKVDPKALLIYTTNNKNTDAQLEQAVSSNTIDTAYINYLRNALREYSDALKNAYADSKSAATRDILKRIFDSTQVLLSSNGLRV